MNYRMIARILGMVLLILAALLVLPLIAGLCYGENVLNFAVTIAAAAALGGIFMLFKPKNRDIYAREGFTAVGLSWILMSLIGALPFVISGDIPSYVDALFETVSGFTTTGASVVPDVEALSHCTLFWRSFTHWIGGMGVLVFLLAILPMAGGSQMYLMQAESPGPSVGKLVPKTRHTALILYSLYILLSIAEFIFLLCGGMSAFDAVNTTFATAGTGGFGIYGDSIAGFSPFLQWAITIFMIAFGVNFNVYFLLYMRRPKDALHCEEMHWYLGIIVAAALMICANAYDVAMTLEGNLRQSFFQVASIITTTGFATTDFNLWPGFSHGILVVLMFVGACAGSTGGGFKVSRIVIGFKSVLAYLGAFLHPRVVRKVKFEDKDVDGETMRAISAYFTAAISLFTISVLLVALDGFDLVTTFSAVAATFNNVGPGLGVAGPTSNFAAFSDFSKVVMTMDMLLGRLEVFPMLMLFYPPLWKESIGEARIRRNRSPFH